MSSTQVPTDSQPRVYRRGRRAHRTVRTPSMPKRDLIGPIPGLVSFHAFGCKEPAESAVSTVSDVPKSPGSDDSSANSADESDGGTQFSNDTSGYGTPPSEDGEPVKLQRELPPITIPPPHSHSRKAPTEVSPVLLRRLSVYSPERPPAVTSPTTVVREMNPLTAEDWGLWTKATRARDALGGLIRLSHGSQVRAHPDGDEN